MKWKCAKCDKVTCGRQPKAREFDAIYPRRHRRMGGATCPGYHQPAVLVESPVAVCL